MQLNRKILKLCLQSIGNTHINGKKKTNDIYLVTIGNKEGKAIIMEQVLNPHKGVSGP